VAETCLYSYRKMKLQDSVYTLTIPLNIAVSIISLLANLCCQCLNNNEGGQSVQCCSDASQDACTAQHYQHQHTVTHLVLSRMTSLTFKATHALT